MFPASPRLRDDAFWRGLGGMKQWSGSRRARRWSGGLLAAVAWGTAAATPWWDDFPALIQTPSVEVAVAARANAVLCGAADDPTWGLYAQRLRMAASRGRIAALHRAGLKALTWFEGFGTCQAYVAQLKRNADGSWVKQPAEPLLTRVFAQHWNWQHFDGAGEIRWVGIPDYFADADFARPWTRVHPRYGSPPLRYPDGRVATGFVGEAADPRRHAVFDAGCSKDVLGRVTFAYGYNPAVNRLRPDTRQPAGPLAGLIRVRNAPPGPPDPGFTPEAWARLRREGYAGTIQAGKDTACPAWIDYLRASVRQALDAGVDGLWVDNFSPWDNFSAWPVQKAFGEWSVAGFRDTLRARFTSAELAAMGLNPETLDTFDVRRYLRDRCRKWGGRPEHFQDRAWFDPRWRDDPIWRAFLGYKRRTGAAALSRFYHLVKAEAAAAGKPDFLVMGNDIPLYSLGWVRGDLDLVSTELSWGWGLTTGPRGLMPPPRGSYAPVYLLAREHARSRFVNVWMYVPAELRGNTNLARVLYYQALAHHALPMPHPGGRTVGTPAVNAEFFAFVRRNAKAWSRREPVAEVGLFHSASSQLMEMLPGGFRDHRRQPHSFAFWGWGTALTRLHRGWRAVPEWKLSADTLRPLRLMIIPEAEVFARSGVPVLEAWVRAGGALLITGASGRRLGETENFARCPGGSTLSALLGDLRDGDGTRPLGRGRVIYRRDDPGLAFYLADARRPRWRELIADILAACPETVPPSLSAPEVPPTVELTLYRRPGRIYIEVNNTDWRPSSDRLVPTPPLRFTVTLPPEWHGKTPRLRVLSPDSPPAGKWIPRGNRRGRIKLAPIPVYASVILEPEGESQNTPPLPP